MLKCIVTRDLLRRSATLAAVLSAGVALMSAQTGSQTAAAAGAPAAVSADAAQPASVTPAPALFSSSAAENAPVPAPTLEASLFPANPFGSPMQYGGGQRGRYGNRPRYRGANTNADGSNKWVFYGGFGLQQPVGNTWHYYTPSWGLQIGGGRQFSKTFALPIEFDYDHAGLTGSTLKNQVTLYNNDINYYCNLNTTNASLCYADGVSDYSSLDGNMHTWSFSIDPTETFWQGNAWGAYAVEDIGFYHKVTNFLAPEAEEYCDPFYGFCEEIEANAIVDHYTSNAPGFGAGLGITYKFSRFSNERFYAEARYVFIDNSYRPGVTVNSPVASTYLETNDFPANSNHTTYFPIKFGIRF
jgi:hypothetical protein